MFTNLDILWHYSKRTQNMVLQFQIEISYKYDSTGGTETVVGIRYGVRTLELSLWVQC